MDEGREGIGRLAVEEDVELHELRVLEPDDVVVEGGVALRNGLELVVEVEDNLGERHLVGKLKTVGRDVVLVYERAPLVEAEFHYRAVEVGLGDDLGADVRFLDVVDEGSGRQS